MMNGVAGGVIGYLLRTKFRDTADVMTAPHENHPGRQPSSVTEPVLRLFGYHLPDQTYLQSFLIVAIIVGVVFYLIIYRSRFGFDLRASGANAAAARSSGVNPKRMILTTMTISGALAGLSGMSVLLG